MKQNIRHLHTITFTTLTTKLTYTSNSIYYSVNTLEASLTKAQHSTQAQLRTN